MWRIHFTADDLARTRISAGLGPLAETMWAMVLFRCPVQRPIAFGGWRDRARGALTPEVRPGLRPLTLLMPRPAQMVDLLSLTGEQPTIEDGLDALLAVPRDRLLTEMADLDRQCALPDGAWALAEPGPSRQSLARAAETAYRTLVEPYWPGISAQLKAEQTARGRIMIDGGMERLLTTLYAPRIRWRPPVLEVLVDGHADLHLNGRGLILAPSVFVAEYPVLMFDLDESRAAPAVLAFPAAGDVSAGLRLWGRGEPAAGTLAALLGRTRAAALDRIAHGCTTTELARQISVSPAAASQHTTVLRDAGLITTRRLGSAVLHTLTPLGADLLAGGLPGSGQPQLTDQAG